MTLILFFLLVFVVGPLIFRAMTKRQPTKGQMLFLLSFALVSAGAALAIRYGLARPLDAEMLMAGVSLLLIWLAWIGVLAFVTQALRRAYPGQKFRRWTSVLGAIGTTIPWFGLAWASILAP
jgi:predicted ABC-type exoprotein transport system permease subunit